MRTRVVLDAESLIKGARDFSRAIGPGRRALLRNLATQVENKAEELSRGPGTAAPGAYPIPVRTGFHRRSFASRTTETSAIVFNTGIAARALHDGFNPYGNPHARPIPARPYFDDALDAVDVDRAHAAWERAMARQAP